MARKECSCGRALRKENIEFEKQILDSRGSMWLIDTCKRPEQTLIKTNGGVRTIIEIKKAMRLKKTLLDD